MKKICILTPTRGRPEGLERFIKSVKDTTTECDLVFMLQKEDPFHADNYAVAKPHGDVFTVDNIGIINKLNILYEFKKGYDYYTIGSDDIVCKTKDWDKTMLNSAETLSKQLGHRHVVLYGNDGIHGKNLCTHPLMSKEFVESTGWFYPPGYMRHLYADNAIGLLAGNTGCLGYVGSVELEHFHFVNGKAKMDDNYKETNSDEAYKRDKAKFEEWIEKEAVKYIDKLRKDMDQYKANSK